MNTRTTTTILVAAGLVVWGASVTDARAQQIECSSAVRNVTAVTNPAGHVITTKYQFDTPNLQPLLATTIESGDGCLIAHLSGQVRITDNYVAFQVRVDGVPLEGQLPLPLFTTPVVFVAIDSSTANDDEQFIDPTKVVSYNFFTMIPKGRISWRCWAPPAAGSIPAIVRRPLISCSRWNIAESEDVEQGDFR
jgi:hypothetical protein